MTTRQNVEGNFDSDMKVAAFIRRIAENNTLSDWDSTQLGYAADVVSRLAAFKRDTCLEIIAVFDARESLAKMESDEKPRRRSRFKFWSRR